MRWVFIELEFRNSKKDAIQFEFGLTSFIFLIIVVKKLLILYFISGTSRLDWI